jgi:bisphosphoglycerate-independent phosphoglycerate mutase (AlkP superfamily)
MGKKEPLMVLGILTTRIFPLFFMEMELKKGTSKRKYEIIDIAPTIANFLQIEFPNGSTGKIIDEVLK